MVMGAVIDAGQHGVLSDYYFCPLEEFLATEKCVGGGGLQVASTGQVLAVL